MNHAEAASLIRKTLPDVGKRARLLVQIIGWLESNYGRGWKDAGVGSHNWGAIQGSYQGSSFPYSDSRPNPADPDNPLRYETTFRAYPNDEEGIADLWSLLKRRYRKAVAKARSGSWGAVSQALYDGGYYEGTHPDPAVNVARHRRRVMDTYATLAPVYGESRGRSVTTVGALLFVGLGIAGWLVKAIR